MLYIFSATIWFTIFVNWFVPPASSNSCVSCRGKCLVKMCTSIIMFFIYQLWQRSITMALFLYLFHWSCIAPCVLLSGPMVTVRNTKDVIAGGIKSSIKGMGIALLRRLAVKVTQKDMNYVSCIEEVWMLLNQSLLQLVFGNYRTCCTSTVHLHMCDINQNLTSFTLDSHVNCIQGPVNIQKDHYSDGSISDGL